MMWSNMFAKVKDLRKKCKNTQQVGLQNMEFFFQTFLSQFFEGEETSFTHSKRIETYNI